MTPIRPISEVWFGWYLDFAIYMYIYIYIYSTIYIYMCVCVYILYTHTHTHSYICIYIYIFIYIFCFHSKIFCHLLICIPNDQLILSYVQTFCYDPTLYYEDDLWPKGGGNFLLAVQQYSIGVIVTPIKPISEVWFGCYLDFPPVWLSTKKENSSVHLHSCVIRVIFCKGGVGIFWWPSNSMP